MIPALERFVVGVPVQAIHNALKPSSIDGFKQMPKNAIAKPHARSFCVSTTRKDRFASVRPSMHRDIVNHSPDSPALLRGEGWGEGCFRSGFAESPLTRRFAPTSPRKRGEVRKEDVKNKSPAQRAGPRISIDRYRSEILVRRGG